MKARIKERTLSKCKGNYKSFYYGLQW